MKSILPQNEYVDVDAGGDEKTSPRHLAYLILSMGKFLPLIFCTKIIVFAVICSHWLV
jgi:hypothetical protein